MFFSDKGTHSESARRTFSGNEVHGHSAFRVVSISYLLGMEMYL